LIQAKAGGGQASETTTDVGCEIASLQGGGRPLPKSEQAFFGSRMGADFSNVRVHNGARAARTARSVNARAFTFGQDVVFGAGEYSPHTPSGRKLLAHELTHVMHQVGKKGLDVLHLDRDTPGLDIQRQCLTGGVCGEPEEREEPRVTSQPEHPDQATE
jgi:hypothetical protein